ncbi:hypothetical protein KFE25_005102 [Diacronema lutheri]|uniref:3-hydroxy-3-methylglutaryl coenzyme A reductase n=2 Tax=Diacronema lutheri TaxID=2081491 RepID=A0A8J5X2M1_DIALT|nr:hypothetical protein KFE25_005102 [Diacronema lutheri]
MLLSKLPLGAAALRVAQRRGAAALCSGALSDAAVLDKLASGQMAFHKLEAELGDPVRAMRLRREHLASTFGAGAHADAIRALPSDALDAAGFYGQVDGACCENVIGYVPLPVGTIGPYKIDGKAVYVPMATTEGALVASTHRGARAISASGGATTELLADGMTRAPALAMPSLKAAAELKRWLEDPASLDELNLAFKATSRFGRLLAVKVGIAGKYAHVRFKCFTGDAMGMNMVSKGVNKVVESILEKYPGTQLLGLSGNMCTDKKPSAINWIDGRGKSVAAEAILPASVVASVLKTTPAAVARLSVHKNLIGSALAGSIGGQNAHASNILTAIYLAAGQDPAQNVESSTCLTLCEEVPAATPGGESSLYVSCMMPSIEVGTVGGGTALAAQAACLGIMGVKGAGETPGANSQQLAKIVCASVMAGELSLLAALSVNHLVSAHMALGRRDRK